MEKRRQKKIKLKTEIKGVGDMEKKEVLFQAYLRYIRFGSDHHNKANITLK